MNWSWSARSKLLNRSSGRLRGWESMAFSWVLEDTAQHKMRVLSGTWRTSSHGHSVHGDQVVHPAAHLSLATRGKLEPEDDVILTPHHACPASSDRLQPVLAIGQTRTPSLPEVCRTGS